MDADIRRAMAASMAKRPFGSADMDRSTAMERVPVVDVGRLEMPLASDSRQSLEQEMAGPAAATNFGKRYALNKQTGMLQEAGPPDRDLGIIGEPPPAQQRGVLAGLFDRDAGARQRPRSLME
jgi:hypothetical protein